MKLITEQIERRLLDNAQSPDEDHWPVVKFFDPSGASTWLITSMDSSDRDIVFGLADLGFGCVELGIVRLSELQDTRGEVGLGIERDRLFEARYPLSVYAETARALGSIPAAIRVLDRAALANTPTAHPSDTSDSA